MKSLLIAGILFLSLVACAETVTSTIDGIVTYLPIKGQIIKKGSILAKYDEEGMDFDIEEKVLEIKCCEKQVEDVKTDIVRYKKLEKSKVVSTAILEDVQVLYHDAIIKLARLKLQLRKLKSDKGDYIIYAPYDCKITKVIIVTNSGREIGDDMLEVHRLDSEEPVSKKIAWSLNNAENNATNES